MTKRRALRRSAARPARDGLLASFRASLAIAAALYVGAACLAPRTASAADYYLEGSVLGGATTWSPTDRNIQGALRTGFSFGDIVGVEVQGRLGYAAVDQRMLEALGAGTKLSIPIKPVAPHLRLGMIHMHEEPVAAVSNDPAGAIVGVGDGIRHRFGIESALGLDWVFAKTKRVRFLASAEGYVDVFPDVKGPLLYSGGGLGIGLQYHL